MGRIRWRRHRAGLADVRLSVVSAARHAVGDSRAGGAGNARVGWLLRWGPVVGWMVVIFGASSISQPSLPRGVTDFHAHFLVYAVLGALMTRAMARVRLRDLTASTVFIAVIWATAYGVSDEFHQAFVPGRVPSMVDILADAIGATAGAFGLWACGIVVAMPRRKDRT